MWVQVPNWVLARFESQSHVFKSQSEVNGFSIKIFQAERTACASVLGQRRNSAFKEVKGSLQTSLVARIRGILWIRDFIPKVMRDLKSCSDLNSYSILTPL